MYPTLSSERSTESMMRVLGLNQGAYYLSLENVSSTSSVFVSVEITALVAE